MRSSMPSTASRRGRYWQITVWSMLSRMPPIFAYSAKYATVGVVRVPYGSALMAQTEVSRSAVNVALTRAHLTWLGVVDDPHAGPMLPPRGRRLATAFRLPGVQIGRAHV